jgi:alkyl sulfatase BDS1-like metallo-beta-lactamase superfamily hydrolase
MMQQATFQQLAAAGKAKFEGDPAVFGRLQGMLVQFDPAFEILPGTKAAVADGPG